MTKTARTAVFLCQGNQSEPSSLDYKRLLWAAQAKAGSLTFEITQACQIEGAAAVARLASEHRLDRFILGACPLAGTAGPLGGELAKTGLTSQAALLLDVCQKPTGGQGPCQVVPGAVTALQQAFSVQAVRCQLPSEERTLSTRVLIIGDGLPALYCVYDLTRAGYQTLLVTPAHRLNPHQPLADPKAIQEAQRLVKELEALNRWEVVRRGRILSLTGTGGDFTVTIMDRQQRQFTRAVGAVIVTQGPPLTLNLPPGVAPHPRIVSLANLAALLSSPEHFGKVIGWQDSPRVGLVLGMGREASPASLRAACLAGRRLIAELDAQVILFTGNAKVAAPDLEELTQAVRGEGVLFVKFTQGTLLLEPCSQAILASFPEEILGRLLEAKLDLVAIDEIPGPDESWRELARVLGLKVWPNGRLQPSQTNVLPVASGRGGLFLVGQARTGADYPCWPDDAQEALRSVERLLNRGRRTVPVGQVKVDRKRCAICLTCVRVCPQGAMGRYERQPFSNPLTCMACGTCASECPMDAIQIAEHNDARYAAEIGASTALSSGLSDVAQQLELLVMACANSAGYALASARLQNQPWPTGARLVQVPCAGKIDPAMVLKALSQGQDGVLVISCFPEACYSLDGNTWVGYRLEHLRHLMDQAGAESARLMEEHLSPVQHSQAISLVEKALERLRLLGPSPLKGSAKVREFLGRFTVSVDHTYVIL